MARKTFRAGSPLPFFIRMLTKLPSKSKVGLILLRYSSVTLQTNWTQVSSDFSKVLTAFSNYDLKVGSQFVKQWERTFSCTIPVTSSTLYCYIIFAMLSPLLRTFSLLACYYIGISSCFLSLLVFDLNAYSPRPIVTRYISLIINFKVFVEDSLVLSTIQSFQKSYLAFSYNSSKPGALTPLYLSIISAFSLRAKPLLYSPLILSRSIDNALSQKLTASSYRPIFFILTQASAALMRQITYSLLIYVYFDKKSLDQPSSISLIACLNFAIASQYFLALNRSLPSSFILVSYLMSMAQIFLYFL